MATAKKVAKKATKKSVVKVKKDGGVVNPVVDVVAILDRSGSMQSIAADAIGGFNTFIEEQQALPGEARLTVVLFDDQYEVLQNAVDIKAAVKLDNKNFVPRGMTALYDAIGKTIQTFKAAGSEKLICTIITDGGENASKEYRRAEQIKELITACEKDLGWTFVFLAANQDAFAVGNTLGVSAANAMNFVADAGGTRGVMKAAGAYATTYRNNFQPPQPDPADPAAPTK